MASYLKFCGCRQCRRGLRTKLGGEIAKQTIRKFRRSAKQSLKKGEEPTPKISVPYTD